MKSRKQAVSSGHPLRSRREKGVLIRLKLVISVSIFSFTLSSCGNLLTLNGESNSVTADENIANKNVGTGGELIIIQSDNVQAAGYDDNSRVMTIQFQNGSIYEYYGVPADLWLSFLAAQPHPWSQVGYPRLVKGGIPYKRLQK
jgi:hypothetical protein